jgi:predicted permease
MNVDTGFDKNNVLVMGIDPAAAGYQTDARLESMMERVEERVGSLPGVGSASFVLYLFDGGSWSTDITVPGRAEDPKDPIVTHNIIGPQFFAAMKMPVILGRGLSLHDTTASRKVAVINETMARTYFTGVSPLGRTFGLEDDDDFQDLEIVGVVKDAKYENLDEKQRPAAFFPHTQHVNGRFLYSFIVRHTGEPASIVPAIRNAIREIDPNLPVGDVTTLATLVDESALDKRLVAELSTFFGMLAIFLSCLGIYGVMSFGIARRTGEFGIRMALGAGRPQVLWVVLKETLRMVALGAGIGLVLALASSWLVESLLFGLRSNDPPTLALAVLMIFAVALFAGYLPARRATQIDPIVALRNE